MSKNPTCRHAFVDFSSTTYPDQCGVIIKRPTYFIPQQYNNQHCTNSIIRHSQPHLQNSIYNQNSMHNQNNIL